MNKPLVPISIRISSELWEKIESYSKAAKRRDFSDGVRSLIDVGLWVFENKDKLDDSKKRAEFEAKMNENLNENQIFDWVKSMDSGTADAISMAMNMKKNGEI